MTKISTFLYRRPVAFVIGLLAFLNPFLFYLTTDFHTSFATAVPGIHIIIRVVSILCAVGVLGLLFVCNLGLWPRFTRHKAVVITYLVMTLLTGLIFIANVVLLILLCSSIPMLRFYFDKEAPFLVGFAFAISLAFIIPHLTDKVKIAIVVGVYVLCGFLLVAVEFWNIEPFDFCTRPVVFDTGHDYSVVWSTTHDSTGYLTYTYLGQQYQVDDQSGYGRLYSARTIHHVNVPYEHLDGNEYTVTSTRFCDNAPYLPQRGKVISETVTFRGRPSGDIHMIAITDNHCLSRTQFNKVRQDDYNVVLMLGDFADFMHQEVDLSDFLLYPAWRLSGGQVPVLYAKGNHDTHSEMGADIAYLLGFDQLYYQTTYGQYTFTVLDSGSCNVDLEEEKYGGVGRYIPYRETELDWMEALTPSAGYDIAIVHVWDFASVAEGIKNEAAEQQATRYAQCLTALGVDFQLSGHKHDLTFFPDGVDTVPVPVLRCGGISAGYVNHSLYYTVLDMVGGEVRMTAYNNRKSAPVWQDTYTMQP